MFRRRGRLRRGGNNRRWRRRVCEALLGGELADEALSNEEADGTGENRVSTDEINHARESSGGGVSVEGRKDEMTGDRYLIAVRGRCRRHESTDHDDIRVEAEDGAKNRRRKNHRRWYKSGFGKCP